MKNHRVKWFITLGIYFFSFVSDGMCAEKSQRAAAVSYVGNFPTVSSWMQAFEKLPKNRQGADIFRHSGFAQCVDIKKIKTKTLWSRWMGTLFPEPSVVISDELQKEFSWNEFRNVLDSWLRMQANGQLSKSAYWSQANNNKIKPGASFYDITQPCEFEPFAQKLIAQPEDVFYIHGDLHGDIFSLLIELKNLKKEGVIDDFFRIVPENVRFVFLGDYVDRGKYGCEVLYTMMRLALANPDRVIAVRGNHEDISLSASYGFKDEVAAKFNDDNQASKYLHISRMNDFLPLVFYVGCQESQDVVNYVQCCHGGVDEEYIPKDFLDNPKTTYQLLGDFEQGHSTASPFDQAKRPYGFMWNDFDVQNSQVDHNIGWRSLEYGQLGTQRVLYTVQSSQKSKIRGIIRAHQHAADPQDFMMKGLVGSNGIYKLWMPYERSDIRHLDDGLVWTFNVSPDSIYGETVGFNFDTYAAFTVAQDYKNWIMKVFNTIVL